MERTEDAGVTAPAAIVTTGARAWRARGQNAALLALGIAASGCTSESTRPATAGVTNAGTDGAAEGRMSVAGSGAVDGAVGGARATGASGGNGDRGEGAGGVADLIAAAGTSSGPASAVSSEGGAGVGVGSGGDGGSRSETGEDARIVLLDGTSLDEWQSLGGDEGASWELPGDGTMVIAPGSGNIVTHRTFEDLFVHVEYKTPALPANVTGQDRGNSGIYLNAMYELQVLDSFGLPPLIDGCGAIYGVSAPRSTACFEQEVWNTYEIEFQAARWDAEGNKQAPARVLSAHLNGVLVQENVDIQSSTGSGEPEARGPGPLMLQDHGNRVAFRNIWVIPR